MIKIYGTSMSRAGRSLWALEELGLQYEHAPIMPQTDTRKPEYLKVNPNGHVPAIDDNGTIIWESMAVNLYLAEKYGKSPFWPATVEGHAAAYQWSFWGMTECEPHLITTFMHKMRLPAEQRKPELVEAAVAGIKAPLKVLDDHMKSREYLLGKDFTVADLNVASVLMLAPMIGIDFSATPAAKAWLDRSLARESLKRSRAKK
jgi:glutathione S-transferase